MAKVIHRSCKCGVTAQHCDARCRKTSTLLSPLVLSSIIQAVSRIVVALLS